MHRTLHTYGWKCLSNWIEFILSLHKVDVLWWRFICIIFFMKCLSDRRKWLIEQVLEWNSSRFGLFELTIPDEVKNTVIWHTFRNVSSVGSCGFSFRTKIGNSRQSASECQARTKLLKLRKYWKKSFASKNHPSLANVLGFTSIIQTEVCFSITKWIFQYYSNFIRA